MKRACLIAVVIGAVVLGGLSLAAWAYHRAHPIAYQLPYKWDSYVRPDLQFSIEPMSHVIAKVNSVIRDVTKGAVPEAIKLDATPTRILKVGSNASLDPYMDQLIADYRENEKEMSRRGARGFESAPFTGHVLGHVTLWWLAEQDEGGLIWEAKEDALHASRRPHEMECRVYPVTDALNELMEENRRTNNYKVDCEPHVSALINATGIYSWSIEVPTGPHSWISEFRYTKVFRYVPEAGVILALATPEEHATAQERLRNPASWYR
jgi:hypothetical protein